MRYPTSYLHGSVTALLLAGLTACNTPSGSGAPTSGSVPSPSASAPLDGDVLATVNGVPIRLSDLHYLLARSDRGRGRGADAQKAKEALDKIIEQELTRQGAEAMGLDTSPEYLRKLRFMEAPVNDFKRTELTELYLGKAIVAQAQVDEAEARQHFDANPERFQTEYHVLQILVRNDDAKIKAMKQQIDAGTPFEEVAATLFSDDLPEGKRPPWDMGLLRRTEVPAAWHDALDKLEEGEVSDILSGPKKRAWIIKLVKRQRNESITFEQVKPNVMQALRSARIAELTAKTLGELRAKAKIVHVREPGAMPPPPEP